MKSSTILRLAAQKIEKAELNNTRCSGLCHAVSSIIHQQVPNIYPPEPFYKRRILILKWLKMFAPSKAIYNEFWFGDTLNYSYYGGRPCPQDVRILAACMAAAYAELNGD
jgi:hypothetical protein